MTQTSHKDIKPIISPFSLTNPSTPLPNSPIVIDSDSSSEFSPLEEIDVADDFDLNIIDAEISEELGEVAPLNPASSQEQSDAFGPIQPDTTELRNPDEIQLSSDEDTKPLIVKLCLPPPVVTQRTCSTQTMESDSEVLPSSKQKMQHKQTIKFSPYNKSRSISKPKASVNRISTKMVETPRTTDITFHNQSNFPLTPPPLPLLPHLPLSNTLSPMFSPNYAMAAAATLSAAAFLQPFLQMQPPPGFPNIATHLVPPVPLVPLEDKTNNRTEEPAQKSPFLEGPSSTCDFLRRDTLQSQPFKPVSKNSHSKPTIKWRNSSHYRDSVGTETEPDGVILTPSPVSTNPLPAFTLTQLRNLTTETGTGTNLESVNTSPDTTIPTLKTSYGSDPLFKLPSSQNSNNSNPELNMELSPVSSGDERIVTYNANPAVAGGRRVIEFSDLAPSTTSEAIENLARNIGSVEEFTFHQGLLYSRATVTFSIPKYALQCRRKYHRHYLDGVHISCNFLQGDVGTILKFPD